MAGFLSRTCLGVMVWALVAGRCLIWAAPAAEGAPTVEFGSSETPPFWSAQLPENGMGGEMLNTISSRIGLESKIVFYPTKRLIEMKTGNHLGDPEHWPDQDFVAVIPIATFRSSFYYYRPNHDREIVFTGLNDLRGYTIGVIKRSIENLAFFESNGIRIEESYKQESLFKKLRLGRIDLCGMVDLSGILIIRKLFPDEAELFRRIPLPRSVSAISIMIDADYPDAVEIANKYKAGLEAILSDGTYLSILEKYYGRENVPKDWFVQLLRFHNRYEQRTVPTVDE
jgi:polar amino acid transport system substrate-binding protein